MCERQRTDFQALLEAAAPAVRCDARSAAEAQENLALRDLWVRCPWRAGAAGGRGEAPRGPGGGLVEQALAGAVEASVPPQPRFGTGRTSCTLWVAREGAARGAGQLRVPA